MASDELLLERLLRVIDEGRRTATYKLALISALIDAVALSPGVDTISTRLIAELVVESYFPQVRRYVANNGIEYELKQISMESSPVARSVFDLRLKADAKKCRSIDEVRRRLTEAFEHTVGEVEDTFARYPIPLLQVVGTQLVPFLYEAEWPEGTSANRLRTSGTSAIRLLPGVAARLIVLGPLLRPLIQMHWASDIAKWSKIELEDEELRRHLFGSERVAFPSDQRDGFAELQDHRCFYCGCPLPKRVEIDHFLAWSRFPNDAIENLVAADRCNGAKSDHLAAAPHVEHWSDRIIDLAAPLRSLATETQWSTNAARSRALVKSTYGVLAVGTPLWSHDREFAAATGPVSHRRPCTTAASPTSKPPALACSTSRTPRTPNASHTDHTHFACPPKHGSTTHQKRPTSEPTKRPTGLKSLDIFRSAGD